MGMGFRLRSIMLLLAGLALVTPAVRAAELPSAQTIIAKLAEAGYPQDEYMTFQQQIELRVLLFTWRFTVDVTYDYGAYQVVVGRGAPSFMPDSLPAELVNVHGSIHLFDLEVVGVEQGPDGHDLYIVEGRRKVPSSQGAQSGRLWVHGNDWYIARAHLAYTWGRLEVEQEYRTEQGRRVLSSQRAVASPLGARVEVKYLDYWFGNR